ncbi:MAG: polymer-forming cytoskeletal protein [Gemmatimonadales bacterium]|nr:MAG: polymer-forming cytoskeletal protein [Gemmatimonadales bacterium]
MQRLPGHPSPLPLSTRAMTLPPPPFRPEVRRNRCLWVGALLILATLLIPTPAVSQTQPTPGPLPVELEQRIVTLANAPGTARTSGRTRIPAGSVVEGDLVVLGGDLRLGGTIRGTLVVANGTLTLEPGARVLGAAIVVGGAVSGEEAGVFQDTLEVWSAPLLYRIRGDRLEGVSREGRVSSQFLATDLGVARTRVTLRAAGAYNRVEGLPVEFGPIFSTGGRNPLELRAFGIWRSEGGLTVDTDRMGYDFALDQAVGGRGTLVAGANVYSRFHPMEDRGMSDLENALSTFLMRRDYRDYHEAQGWSTHLEFRPIRQPIVTRLTFREEEHQTAPVRGPWTLGDEDRPWRLQPRAAEGTAQFVEGALTLDTRDDPDQPADGWLLELRGVQQVSGRLRGPSASVDQGGPNGGTETGDPALGLAYDRVGWGRVDVRRYARLGPDSRLAVRLFSAGSHGSSPLPPQFQSTLGGEGSLPGHPRFAVDCGVRGHSNLTTRQGGEMDGEWEFFPAYGCDRVEMAQVEFQYSLPFSWNPFPDDWGDPEWSTALRFQPTLSVFVNTGQGRAANRDGFPDRMDSGRRADVGFGLLTGSLGFYWAHPINRRDRGLNFFVRLDRRF